MRKNAITVGVSVAAVLVGLGGASASAATTTQPVTPEMQAAGYDITVQPGDTLTKIGETNSTTYMRLYNANTNINDPNMIFAGENLRIPAPDEQLPDRPLPEKVKVAASSAGQAASTKTSKVSASTSGGDVWDRLARCEAGGNWSINTGNGYYGGLQFSQSSWKAVGGSGLPSNASREEQIQRGQMLQARQGWGAWPSCSAKLGLN